MLPLRPRRYRSSTSVSASARHPTKATEVLQNLLDGLGATVAAAATRADGYPSIEELLEQTRQLHQHIAAVNPPSPQQDDFRRLNGFQCLLDLLRSFSGFYNPQKLTEAERRGLFDLLHIVLAVLSATFRGHPGNRRF